ncbi:MAG: hypothetical protein IJR17_07845 [Clostridia bacterium]|nr:hypothetical protein [Clostridia bacterium]
MKRYMCLLLALVLALGLAGCQEKTKDPLLGTYVGTRAEHEEGMLPVQDVLPDGATGLKLKKGGRCTVTLGGQSASGKWLLEDEEDLTFTFEEEEYYGYVEDGTLLVDFDGVYITFVKEGELGLGPDAYSEDRQYYAIADRDEMTEVELDLLAMARLLDYNIYERGLWFGEDGTGVLELPEENLVFSYTGRDLFFENGTGTGYTLLPDGHVQVLYEDHVLSFAPEEEVDKALEADYEDADWDGEEDDFDAEPDWEDPEDGEDIEPLPLAPTARPATAAMDPQSYWNGDWYGYWYIDSKGRSEGYADLGDYTFDVCARIEVDGGGVGTLYLYEEEGDPDEMVELAEAEIRIAPGGSGAGTLITTDGYFWEFDEQDLSDGTWRVDPTDTEVSRYEHMIEITCPYSDGDGDFIYHIILRPWGMSWSDVPVSGHPGRPYYYSDWYLPLINMNLGCPVEF